jgi:hypothetical protein
MRLNPESRSGLSKRETSMMKRTGIHPLGLAAVAILASLFVGTAARAEETKKEAEPFKRLTVDEVEKRLADPKVHVYDGNNDELYLDGHIPGAVHLLSKDIKEGVLPSDKSTPLIFYCHSER